MEFGKQAADILTVAMELLDNLDRFGYTDIVGGFNLLLNLPTPAPAPPRHCLHAAVLAAKGIVVTGGAVRIYSALVDDGALRAALDKLGRQDDETEEILRATYVDRYDGSVETMLPHICVDARGAFDIPPAVILGWYRAGPWKRWQAGLWDGQPKRGSRKGSRPEILIRTLTIDSLRDAGLTARKAMRAWNEVAPPKVRFDLQERADMSSESNASRDVRRARKATTRLWDLVRRAHAG